MANTSSQGGPKPKSKSKGKIVNLDELLGSNINWAEEVENEAQNVGGGPTTTTVEIKTKVTHARMSLPSGPKASRGDVLIDMDKLPLEAPFVAYMGNIAYNANDRSIQEFFGGLDIINIRMMTDNGRPKGFCYIEFGSRADLAEALKLNNERLVGRPVKIDLADQERDRKKPFEQQQNREGGGRQRYNAPGGAGQAEATGDWRAESRSYAPPAHTMARDRGPPPHQEMQHYATMPSGLPPPAPYGNPRYSNDRPDYAIRHGYGPPPAHQGPQAPQPYGHGPPGAGGYYPPPYGDPVNSGPMDQRYYPTDNRKRRENDYGRGYNTMGARPHRDQRDQRYDLGYESERDYDQQNYRYRQQQLDYGGHPQRMGHRGGGHQNPSGGYPMIRQGSQGSYAGYGSDTEGYHRSKPVEPYSRGANYPAYPPFQQPQQQHFKMYQDTMDSNDNRRGGAPPRRDYGNGSGANHRGVPQQRPQRREHKLSTTSTVSVDESLCESDISIPKERRKLALQPRTKPVAEVAAPIEKSSSGIFGGAKPVDTRQVEDKAEEKILKLKEETKKRDSVSHSTSDSNIGSSQKAGSIQSHRNSSVNSSRSSPVEDPKPSVTPTTPTSVAPEAVKFAPIAGSVTILRRRTTSSQNDANDPSSKTDETLTADEKPSEHSKNELGHSERTHENVSNRGNRERRGDNNRHRGGGHQGNGHRGGRNYPDRPPRFQDAEGRPKEYERRGSQDSLVFTRGGGGRNKGRRGFAVAGGGRGRSFDEGDTKAYQRLDAQAQHQQPPIRRQHSNRLPPSDRRDSNPRPDDDPQAPPAAQLQRKKSRDKPVDKKPPLPVRENDEPPVYTDVNMFSLLQTMSEDE